MLKAKRADKRCCSVYRLCGSVGNNLYLLGEAVFLYIYRYLFTASFTIKNYNASTCNIFVFTKKFRFAT